MAKKETKPAETGASKSDDAEKIPAAGPQEQLPIQQKETKPAETGASGLVANAVISNDPKYMPTATMESISRGNEKPPVQHPNDVKFLVEYSEDFAGKKTFEEGSVQIISKESAEHFAKLGFGSII